LFYFISLFNSSITIGFSFCYTSNYPTNDIAEFYYNKAIVLQELKMKVEAIETLNKALELNPKYYEASCLKGEVLGKMEKYVEAIDVLDKAIELTPNLARAYNEKGMNLNL